jgi:hypothetical protein
VARIPRIVAIISIVAGAIMIVAGAVTYYVVHRELSDEHIVVSADAAHFGGKDVKGPFTAYYQAQAIKEHATKIGNGKTYAQLAQDDPKRNTVLTASFLRSSLFTSVVAFGVAVLVMGLGVLFILVGLALLGILRRITDATPPDPATTEQNPPQPAVA